MLEERRLVRCEACDRPFWLTLRYEDEAAPVWRSVDCPREGCGEPTYLLFPGAVEEAALTTLDPHYPMARRPSTPRASLQVRIGLDARPKPSAQSPAAGPMVDDKKG